MMFNIKKGPFEKSLELYEPLKNFDTENCDSSRIKVGLTLNPPSDYDPNFRIFLKKR